MGFTRAELASYQDAVVPDLLPPPGMPLRLLFVGIAFQPFVYMLIAMQIGLDTYLTRRRKEAAWRPIKDMRTRMKEAAAQN